MLLSILFSVVVGIIIIKLFVKHLLSDKFVNVFSWDEEAICNLLCWVFIIQQENNMFFNDIDYNITSDNDSDIINENMGNNNLNI